MMFFDRPPRPILRDPPVWESGPANTGWQCPGCGRCYAPTVEQCPHCGPKATDEATDVGAEIRP